MARLSGVVAYVETKAEAWNSLLEDNVGEDYTVEHHSIMMILMVKENLRSKREESNICSQCLKEDFRSVRDEDGT